MKTRTILRHLREGFKNIIRNGWMTFASISSITISLFILGVFLLLSMNVNYFAEQVESDVKIEVFLEVNLPKERVDAIGKQIEAIPGVWKNTYVSKEEGLEYLKEQLGDVLEGTEEDNPLMDAFTVEVEDPRNIEAVANSILALDQGKAEPELFKVNYGKGVVEQLFKVTDTIRNVGFVLVALLAVTAIFLIANTIKLTIMARDTEISIMKLVGATNWFIRWPFFIEGALLGFIGSIIPTAVILFTYWKFDSNDSLNVSLLMVSFKPFKEIYLPITAILIVLGICIGVWGSVMSVRKSLKV
jgi:cell division transport system permease protein